MSNPAAIDDTALIAQVAKAQPEALGELYDRYNRLVFSVALAMVRDRDTAEDIALEVFVLVWQRAATYRPELGRVSTWLVAIARHHAIDFLRSHGRRAESRSVAWDHVSEQANRITREMEDRLEHSLQRERVQAAIAQLPAEQREALALAYFGGYTHEEISSLLSLPLGTVKTRIRLAMHRLRDLLQDEQPPADKSG
jgi:RNA polymerase sigma-70 factor (ECF subfamily)